MKFTESMNEDFYTWSAQGHPMNELVAMLNDKYDLGLTLAILQHKKRELRFSGWWDDPKRTAAGPGQQSSEINIQVKSGEDLTPERIMELHGYDPSAWTIVSNTSSAWNKTADGLSFSSKLVVKPVKDGISPAQFLDVLNRDVKPVEIKQTNSGKTNLVIPLADLHFGWTTYDDMTVVLDNLGQIVSRGFDNIVILGIGDLFHSDSIHQSVTANGTELDDVDMIKALDDADKFMNAIISMSLANANHVSLYSIAGNHDADTGYLYMRGLQYKYPQVQWTNSPKYRLGFQLGQCGFLLTHGNIAAKRIPMLFATDYVKIWSSSATRTVFSGHYHTQKTTDEGGVVLRQLGTKKPTDPYEQKNGYTMSRREFQVFEYDVSRLVATYEL